MTIEEFFILFSKITVATMILPIMVAIWNRKYLKKPATVFLYYRIFALLFNLLQQAFIWYVMNYYEEVKPYLEYWNIKNTSFLAILFQLNNFIFLGWFYSLLTPSKYAIWIKRIAFFLFFSTLINYLFIEGREFGVFNPNATAIFTFGIALFYLWHLYRSVLALRLEKNAYFWFSLALILPYLASFFLFLVGDESEKEDYPFFLSLTILKNVFLIIGQILMAIGFWYMKYTRFLVLPSKDPSKKSDLYNS